MKYKIIVDKQSRTNPSNEKKEYEIDIEELHCRGDIYDSLVITKDEDYVIRRLQKNEYNVLNILQEPIKEPLENINIELFEGNNYIYLLDMVGNKFYAEYLIKNDFNDLYVVKRELATAIDQVAGRLELSVNQKLDDRLTGAKIMMAINGDQSEIQIDADKINIEGKAVKFKTKTSNSHIYTQEDAQKVIDYYLGQGTLTIEEMDLYNINGNKKINLTDAQLIIDIVNYNEGKNEGSFEINPYDPRKCIIIKDFRGNERVALGTYTAHFSEVDAKTIFLDDENLSTIIDDLTNRIQQLEQGG